MYKSAILCTGCLLGALSLAGCGRLDPYGMHTPAYRGGAVVAGVTTVSEDYDTFNQIVINSASDVTITHSDSALGYHYTVSESPMERDHTHLADHTLTIDPAGAAHHPITIYTDNVDKLVNKGSGSITYNNASTHGMTVVNTGAGNITVSGNDLRLQKVTVRGAGNVNIDNVKTTNLNVGVYGSGSVQISGMVGLRGLVTAGTGHVNIASVIPTPFNIQAAGIGPINLDGKVNLQTLTHSGLGDVNVAGLDTQNLIIDESGPGNLNLLGKAHLRSISYTGSGTINLFKAVYDEGNVAISSNGSGVINIDGAFNLAYLAHTKHSEINAKWIKSRKLSIYAKGDGMIKLAGVAGQVDAYLSENVQLDMKYLHAKGGYVKTANTSQAEVWMSNSLKTHARDTSNIYYFTKPDFLGVYTSQRGAVLPADEALLNYAHTFQG